MKKLMYMAALLAVAAGSFAFLPKQTTIPQYGMLVTRNEHHAMSKAPDEVYVVTAAGASPKLENIKLQGKPEERFGNLHQLEADRLSELAASNWKLSSSHSRSTVNGVIETTFVLEKQ